MCVGKDGLPLSLSIHSGALGGLLQLAKVYSRLTHMSFPRKKSYLSGVGIGVEAERLPAPAHLLKSNNTVMVECWRRVQRQLAKVILCGFYIESVFLEKVISIFLSLICLIAISLSSYTCMYVYIYICTCYVYVYALCVPGCLHTVGGIGNRPCAWTQNEHSPPPARSLFPPNLFLQIFFKSFEFFDFLIF